MKVQASQAAVETAAWRPAKQRASEAGEAFTLPQQPVKAQRPEPAAKRDVAADAAAKTQPSQDDSQAETPPQMDVEPGDDAAMA